MREYFRGWRRKMGFCTLLMACVFVAGWTRSWVIYDNVQIRSSRRSYEIFISDRGQLVWVSTDYDSDGWAIAASQWTAFRQVDLTIDGDGFPYPEGIPYVDNDDRINWDFRTPTFGLGHRPRIGSDVSASMVGFISYSSIVIPLTLLSACLLLSKPKPTPLPAMPEQPTA